MLNHRRNVTAILAAIVIGAWTAAGAGQTASRGAAGTAQAASAPQRVIVNTTQVKPEMVTAWQELIRTEALPAQKKAGVAFRSTFANGGPVGQAFTFVTVTPFANYAEFDRPNPLQRALGTEGVAKYNAKLRPMIVSSENVIQTLVQNASIQSFSATPPPLLGVTTLQLLPGKAQEWTQITTQEIIPAFKKIGVADYWVFTTNFGASNLQRTIVTPLAKWADLDGAGPGTGPLARAVGQEAAQKINQRRNALVASSEATIVRYLPDLSFGAPARPTSSQQ